ncbi:hypothetical protein BDQ94DRAFT_173017 [Aspergillus welwitschiae]|uniref:Uncharacterized protein n=1 Tax=Aspergillus welwitschiae TaxID=1341132 RepID=A0A3F3PU93_9EURO|nr:hypothetical protein BDQ94DRAFT_173017 [Aspergillus welwitschiae]RDH30322.1 hypothetical protein BDQ94DRAFT_173017 [Aspergillus welwitschiae]
MDRQSSTPDPSHISDQQTAEAAGLHNYREVVPGWTDDPRALSHFFYPGSPEWYLARQYGIRDATVVLVGTNQSGEMQYIITANGHYYWGHLMMDEIFEISRPTTWPNIRRVMAEKGVGKVGMKKLNAIEIPEDEDTLVPDVPEGENLYVPYGQDAPSKSARPE